LLPNLVATDWLILLMYLLCVLAIGFSLRLNIKTSKDFLEAGRALPAWLCGLAFVAAGLGAEEVIAMGAAGARYGFAAAQFFCIGAVPAMLFAAIFMVPLYYGSGARSVPAYLRLRFDQKTRLLNACTFALMTLASAGISLYLMARVFQALRVFDGLFYAFNWPRQGIFPLCILLPAAIVLAYVLFAGLAGAMVNQALQFLLLMAGFLPMVVLGLKNIGGWSGLKAALPGLKVAVPAGSLHGWSGAAHGATLPAAAIGLLLGVVLGAGHWTTDFRILQTALAAKSSESARRVPLIAAAVRLFLPFGLILPGLIAIGLPTPHTTTVIRNENGMIYHEITIVPKEAEAGRGLVPGRLDLAHADPASGNLLLLDAAGHPLLNYAMATPNMLVHFLPKGLLGLGLAALMASLMSGLAAGLAAFNTVFTVDLYEGCICEGCIRDADNDAASLAMGHWAAAGGMALAIGVACACARLNFDFSNFLYPLLLVFAVVNAPQLATFLLGMFTKRATGHGAFAGLAAGTAAAILLYGITLPGDARPGLYGGWIAVVHRYPGFVAQCFWMAILGFAVNLMVAAVVSLSTEARPEKELTGLVHSLTPRPATAMRWKSPEAMAVVILLAAIALGFFFA
jgi:SSS family solute:Na+ symporter